MQNSPIIIPEFNFPPNTDFKFIEGFYNYIKSIKVTDTHLSSPDFDIKIERVKEYLKKYFWDNLNIDVSNRLLTRDRIHFLEDEELKRIAKSLNYPENTRGFFSSTYFHIFINITNNDGVVRSESSLLKSLCHELIHGLEHKAIIFTPRKTAILTEVGFSNSTEPDIFSHLKEGLIDMTAMKTIKKYWRADDLLSSCAEEAFFESGYKYEIIILDAILEFLETRSDHTYRELFELLAKDLVLGSKDSLEIVEKYLGPAAFQFYKYAPVTKLRSPGVEDFATSLELDSFINEWKESKNGEDYIYCKKL